ncbi:MAG: hypothetical protein HQ581_13270, partial [Planctomycetes bacterium]|nr:hypothetical protein [Planctomycetota bacterium]
KTTRATKNGQVTKIQFAKAAKTMEQLATRIAALEKVQAESAQTIQHILGSDFMANHAAFRKMTMDLEEGMPGISMPE